MTTFFADLDNTLIYSHRREIGNDKLPVEWLHDREQSYMTRKSHDFFMNVRQLSVVPMTSRTMEQYGRLAGIADSFGWEYALICNGGILLKNGEICREWLDETYRMTSDSAAEFERACKLISAENDAVHLTEKIMVYASFDEPQRVESILKENLDSKLVSVFSDHRKVYCVPKKINKGIAVQRFREMGLADGITIAAGDGEQDVPMLENVDIPIVPDALYEKITNSGKILADNSQVFSDGISDILKEIS